MTKRPASSGPNSKPDTGSGRLRFVLQARDSELLASLFKHGLMARRHIESQFFTSTQRANARLLQYLAHGFVRRVSLPAVSVTAQAVYTVGAAAYPVIAAQLDMDVGEVRRVCRLRSGQHVAHTLGLLDLLLAAQDAAHARDGVALDLTLSEYECRHEYRLRQAGLSRSCVFRPDGYLRLALPKGVYRSFFLEYDRANASSRKWAETVSHHQQYASLGLFKEVYGVEGGFETLTVTCGGPRRLEHMRKVASERGAGFFRFATEEDVHARGFLAPIWRSTVEQEPAPLV